jgi:NAD(P)H-hydrate epimerase
VIPILTSEQSAELDRASGERGVGVDILMANAGWAVARVVLTLAGGAYGRRALMVCGKGNNGGDGLVAARHLRARGMAVTAILLARPAELSPATATAFREYVDAGGRWRRFSADVVRREAARSDVAVDAIVGTGFRGPARGTVAEAIAVLGEATGSVVAVDVPSGVDADTGVVDGEAVEADATVTFGALKPGLVFHPGADRAGAVMVADIGFPPDLVTSDVSLIERTDVASLLPVRPSETQKRTVGALLVVAGSRSMTGAAVLVATAATRAGAGLVTLAVPEGILRVVEEAVAEATFLPLPETPGGAVAEEAWPVIEDRLGGVRAFAMGPGLSTDPGTAGFIRTAAVRSPVPVVVDADAITAFAGRSAELSRRASDAVLTPHAGEFERLTGISAAEALADRVGSARKAAAETGATVLLKGSRTVVADPRGRVTVNPTGGPFLATGGTGDVLTGTIGAFLAQGMAAPDAAAAGAYVHGLAGSAAASGARPIVAGDVAAALPEAIAEIRKDAS